MYTGSSGTDSARMKMDCTFFFLEKTHQSDYALFFLVPSSQCFAFHVEETVHGLNFSLQNEQSPRQLAPLMLSQKK